jgi:hypothetical protein
MQATGPGTYLFGTSMMRDPDGIRTRRASGAPTIAVCSGLQCAAAVLCNFRGHTQCGRDSHAHLELKILECQMLFKQVNH